MEVKKNPLHLCDLFQVLDYFNKKTEYRKKCDKEV